MLFTLRRLSIILVAGVVAACVSMPTGPSVMTLPGTGKSFEQFRFDDFECRAYAHQQIGGKTPRQLSQVSGIESAAVGAGLGAAAGAAIGGGQGAAIGAGTGFLAGGVVGSDTANTSGYMSQRQYDMSYIQCMYAKGHRVPVAGRITGNQPASSISPRITNPVENFTPPPPPAGNPPPPPPQ